MCRQQSSNHAPPELPPSHSVFQAWHLWHSALTPTASSKSGCPLDAALLSFVPLQALGPVSGCSSTRKVLVQEALSHLSWSSLRESLISLILWCLFLNMHEFLHLPACEGHLFLCLFLLLTLLLYPQAWNRAGHSCQSHLLYLDTGIMSDIVTAFYYQSEWQRDTTPMTTNSPCGPLVTEWLHRRFDGYCFSLVVGNLSHCRLAVPRRPKDEAGACRANRAELTKALR